MKYTYLPILVCSLASFAISVPITGNFTDSRDHQTYKTVKIGSKTWMAQNLNYKMPGSACYDNEEEKCKNYGRLYTFSSAVKACPAGWHLPEDEEWTMFKKFIEDSDGKEDAWVSLKSRDKWDGSDRYGFDVVPAGKATDGFLELGVSAHFWSATEEDGDAFGWHLAPPGDFSRDFDISTNMYSVRCLRN
ncbi:MAG: fibrobacter succinogenes major paralogous domain-containing protein [Paludibacteraceae bacterium]|nr:fibrobacter succinogenes major paralogous domain-containing protein [Paludibacteraceae bacterium]